MTEWCKHGLSTRYDCRWCRGVRLPQPPPSGSPETAAWDVPRIPPTVAGNRTERRRARALARRIAR